MSNEDTTNRWVTWLPIIVSFGTLLALLLLDVPERVFAPKVLVAMPETVLLAQAETDGNSRVYLQPAFVSTGRSRRAEVLTDLQLYVKREHDKACMEFEVEWIGDYRSDPGGRPGPSLEIEGGPSSLVVTQEAPQTALFAFRPKEKEAEGAFFVGNGTYSMTLAAERVVGDDPLVGTIRVDNVRQTGLKKANLTIEEPDFRNRYVKYDAKPVTNGKPSGNCVPPA